MMGMDFGLYGYSEWWDSKVVILHILNDCSAWIGVRILQLVFCQMLADYPKSYLI